MWGLMRAGPAGVRPHQAVAIWSAILGLFVAMVVTIALTALGSSDLMSRSWNGLGCRMFRVSAWHCGWRRCWCRLLVSWLLFTWIIARLPRESVSFRSALRAGTARGGGLRGLQAGGLDLSAVGRDRSGRSDVRSGAGSDGVRLHHRAAHPVRHRVGRDVDREPRRRTGRAARTRPDHPARRRSARAWACAERWPPRRWGPWRAEPFAVTPQRLAADGAPVQRPRHPR